MPRARRRAPDAGLAGTLLARGASGRQYALHAALTEPDPAGRTLRVVTVTPEGAMDASAELAARYGFSPREHAVLLRVARGESTKANAAALGLSAYTVHDHVGRASAKVGVTTRRELVAKLFLDALGG